MEQYKKIADDLSLKWNIADKQHNLELREEIGDILYRCLEEIEKRTGERYRPIEEVDSL